MKLSSNISVKTFLLALLIVISSKFLFARNDWLETESENFLVLYRPAHAHLVPKIINSAENALSEIKKLFNYTPSEKIVINTYDAADFGFGAATTVPQNYIRLEIEPFEIGYETVPFNDRIQWVLSHELVHIAVNDHASNVESFFRSIFSKVAPEQSHPITVFYSLLTNFSRYTPRWHQEAIAVFIETWFSGGYGRLLGNFDEMYFRSLVLEDEEFPTHLSLDTKTSHNSFLLENSFYLYGTRFCAYLLYNYGPDKLLQWFIAQDNDFYDSFVSKFESVYGLDFHDEWSRFIEFEKEFQNKNLERLNKSPLSKICRISDDIIGWPSQPFFVKKDSAMILGYHKPHQLAGIQFFDLNNFESRKIASLPTPSIQQVTSTAYDSVTNLFFYTTNNNQLYRDIRVMDAASKEDKILFKDCRIGDITVSPVTHELWGVQHDEAKISLIFSPYPYSTIIPLISFNVGDEISNLSIDPFGKNLAAVLHRSSGEQSIIITECDNLKNGGKFEFKTITKSGSPENPSWSPDGKTLFWNAYINGVSNIYRMNINEDEPQPVSHTFSGLFKPVYLNEDSLFVFEFSSNGFIPAIIENKPVEYLPAIEYLGQKILEKYPYLSNWALKYVPSDSFVVAVKNDAEEYSGLANLNIHAFVPIISGFQKQKVLGFFTHIADPLYTHDLTLEIGYSPFNENPLSPKFHFKGRYEYLKKFDFGIDHNAPDFYDLFNDRKRGMIGTKWRFGHTNYWMYDNPLKMKQNTEISVYTDVEFINDNLVRVSEPDFFVAQTNFNMRNFRRSIGSSDFEYGQELTGTVMVFGADPHDPQYSVQFFSDFANLGTWISPHNIWHVKFGAGYRTKNEQLNQALFYFGGFGNRALENVDFKQYRSLFRFPGIPIYSLPAESFFKLLVENNFPPIRFGSAGIGQHYLNHIDFSIYSQSLIANSPVAERWIDIGAQINFIFKHWFNLESTLSAGIAQSWNENTKDWECFISYKLLRN